MRTALVNRSMSWLRINVLFISTVVSLCSSVVVGQLSGSPAKLSSDSTREKIAKDELQSPSDTALDRQDTTGIKKDTLSVRKDTLDIITGEASFNTIPGFRVQLTSTQDLLEAIDARSKADTLLNNYDVYIIYDSPYYKVRAGDFRTRYEASQAANYIASHGFPDAWSVPDNVLKNPLKKN